MYNILEKNIKLIDNNLENEKVFSIIMITKQFNEETSSYITNLPPL